MAKTPGRRFNHLLSPLRKPTLFTSAFVVLAAGFLVLFMGGGARFAIGLTLKPMVEEFGWDRSQLGIAVAVFQIVSAATMYVAGVLADRMSLRLVLGGGLAASGVAIGLMSLVGAPWHAVVLYGCLYAIGNGAASITAVGVMVTRAFPGRTGLANAVVSSGMSVGQLVMIAVLAAVLVTIGWRSVFVWLGVAHLLLLPFLLAAIPGAADGKSPANTPPRSGHSVAEAARTRQFWLLVLVYAFCGFSDFFVSTHVVAFAQDRGISTFLAGNLLALMGLTGLLGVIAAGHWSDRSGPVWPAAVCFVARVAVFALVMIDQSPVSVAVFALVFGLTFLVTAPLNVVFVRDSFGTKNLGALTGLIIMVHHICGGIGAYVGASIFDATSRYDIAFALMLVTSIAALVLTLALRRPREVI
ncbi:MAG: MFS transporter [Betaproteobacteria bacterium]|nr:MFS transporter [Betaproteobacteria bacterium]